MKLRHLTCAAFAAVSVLALPASASAASATLIADPSPLAFGAVRVNTSLQLQLVITNNGPDAVRLDNAPVFDSTGSGRTPVFRLTSAGTTCTIGGTLPVGSSCAQGVIFEPVSQGNVNDTLILNETAVGASDESPVQLLVNVAGHGYVPLRISGAGTNVSSFYPRVQHSYRDSVRYTVSFNQDALGRVQVLNGAGVVVKRFPFSATQHLSVEWRGRKDNGKRAKPGTFRFRTVVRAEDRAAGSDKGGVAYVRVKTGWVSVHHRVRRSGVNTSSRSGSSCHWHNVSGTVILDSWGGYCRASWNIAVPRRATHVRWGMGAGRDAFLWTYSARCRMALPAPHAACSSRRIRWRLGCA